MAGCVYIQSNTVSNNPSVADLMNIETAVDRFNAETNSYQSQRDSLFENFKDVKSLTDYETFLSNNKEGLSRLGDTDIQRLKDIFSGKSKLKDFAGINIAEDLQNELLEGLGDREGFLEDEDAVKAVREGIYLPNRVSTNILDKYHTPNYHMRLYVANKQHVIDMHQPSTTDLRSSLSYDLAEPDPSDQVVIAETGATDITIDDLQIGHMATTGDEINSNRSVAQTFSFKLIEPGSITLLDRIAAAKTYCGWDENRSATATNTDSVLASDRQIPLYLDVTFVGYPDVDDSGEPVEDVNPQKIGKTFVYELGAISFDMEITPEGAVYNFNAFNMHDMARFSEYTTFKEEVIISGSTITELLTKLETAINSQLQTNEQENSSSPEGGANENQTNATQSPATPEFNIHWLHMFYDPNGTSEDNPDLDDGFEQNMNEAGKLTNRIYIDPDLVTPTNFANTPEFYRKNHGDPGGGIGDMFDTNDYAYGNIDVGALGDDLGGIEATVTNAGSGENLNISDTEMSAEQEKKIRVILSDKAKVSLRFPAGKTIYDAIYTIMSLSADLMERATRLKDIEDPSKGVDYERTFVTWFNIAHTLNFDYEIFDPDLGKYKPRIEFSIHRVETPRTDIGTDKAEFNELQEEVIVKRVQELRVQKEYLYMYTGLNDQIITLNMNFDNAMTIRVPFYGIGDATAQLAFAAAGDKTLDEAREKNPLLLSPNKSQTEAQQKKTIANFLDDIRNFANDAKTSTQEAISDLFSGGGTGLGFTTESIKTALQNKGSREEEEFINALQNDRVLRDAINASITKRRISEQSESPTSSDQDEELTADQESRLVNVPIFSSQIVPGLEGPGDDPRIAERFQDILDEDIKAFSDRPASQAGRDIEVTTNSSRENITQPVERGSVRGMAFAHLMSQHSGAAATLTLDMTIRGDPWWWGKRDFYDYDKVDNEYITDLDGAFHDTSGPTVLLMIESPRKLDFNVDDEDENTGLYDFGHLNYTMSGAYRVVRCDSSLSGGVFETQLELKRLDYEVSKLERVKKAVEQRISELEEEIKNVDGGDPEDISGRANEVISNTPGGTDVTGVGVEDVQGGIGG